MIHKQALPVWKFGADRISGKTAFFNGGKLIEYADTKQLFEQPHEVEMQRYLAGKFG